MYQHIYNILRKVLGNSKNGGYELNNYQYQFNCPCCAEENGYMPDNKYNLEVNLKLFKYHCWKCGDINGTKGDLLSLIKKYGNQNDVRDLSDITSQMIRSRMYDINCFNRETNGNTENDYDFITLPKTFRKIDLRTTYNKQLVSYLEKRRITQDIINKFNIGCTDWSEQSISMRNRIIIPSYDEHGELNYWVGRTFYDSNNKNVFKYKNCKRNKMDIIFQESLINWDFDIILCEGAIDCLYAPNTISLLGKTLSTKSELYRKIRERANANVTIALDSDTTVEETADIYRKLNTGRLSGKIWFVNLNKYKDFGETYENEGSGGIVRLMRTREKFDIINKLKFKIYD